MFYIAFPSPYNVRRGKNVGYLSENDLIIAIGISMYLCILAIFRIQLIYPIVS